MHAKQLTCMVWAGNSIFILGSGCCFKISCIPSGVNLGWLQFSSCPYRPIASPRMLYILLKSSRGKYCAFSTRIFVLSRKMFSKGLEEFVFQILIFQYDNYFKFSILEEDCIWNSFESLALNGRVIDDWWQWHYRKQLVVFCFALVHMQS